MKSLRIITKLTLIFLGFSLIPAVPLAFLSAKLYTKGIDIWGNERLQYTLSDSFALTKTLLQKYETDVLQKVQTAVSTLKTQTLQLPKNLPSEKFGLDSLKVFPLKGYLTEQELEKITAGESITTLVDSKNRKLIRAISPISDAEGVVIGYGVGEYFLPEDIVERIENVNGMYQILRQVQLLRNPLKTVLWILFGVGTTLIVVIAIVAARTMSRSIEKPIQELVGGTSKIASGEFGYEIGIKRRDEFGILINGFNSMSRELKSQKKSLEDAVKLAAWQGVARRIAHEIKNSLTPIGLSLHRLASGKKSEKDRKCIATIKDELNSLTTLASSFSEFAKLPSPVLKEVNLNEVLKSVVNFYRNSIKIITNYQKNPPLVLADADQMRRVFTNLVKNGVEAAGSGGELRIRTGSDREYFNVEIADNGDGIPEDMKEKIFEPYVTTKKKGSGLGLAIVKKIVTDHNGKITFDSKTGAGTMVTVELPIKAGSKDEK